MTVVRQRCFLGQAAGESPYESNEEEVEEEGDWKVEERAAWCKERNAVGDWGLRIRVKQGAMVQDREDSREKDLPDDSS